MDEWMSSPAKDHLSHCLDCGYSLTGLPTRHRCPECGWEYDQFTRVWRKKDRWLAVKELCVSLILIILFAAGFSAGFAVSPTMGTVLQLFVVFVFACVLIVRWRCYSTRRQGEFVAITPEGIRARQHEMLEPVLIRWEAIEAIDPGETGLLCRVIHRSSVFDGKENVEVELTGMFDTTDDVLAFAEHARARLSLVHEERTPPDSAPHGPRICRAGCKVGKGPARTLRQDSPAADDADDVSWLY
jgi:hypothetical protein